MLFVFVSAVSMLVLTWAVVVGPVIAARFDPSLTQSFMLDAHDLARRHLALRLCRRRHRRAAVRVPPVARRRASAASRTCGPACCCRWCCGCVAASLYSYYLNFSDYTRFYAGLSQLMVAMIFFQITAVIVILGAELNRGIIEFKKHDATARPATARTPLARPLSRIAQRSGPRPASAIAEAAQLLAHAAGWPRARPRRSAGPWSAPRPAPPCCPACARCASCACAPWGSASQGNTSDMHGSMRRSTTSLLACAACMQVGEVRALHALLVHPQIAGVHRQVVARGAGADDDHAAALHDEHRDRERRLAGMLEHAVDVVALAGDLPDRRAELARAP